MRAPANDKKPKQSRLFLIGWIFILTNQKALCFEDRMLGFVYVNGNFFQMDIFKKPHIASQLALRQIFKSNMQYVSHSVGFYLGKTRKKYPVMLANLLNGASITSEQVHQ